MNFSATYDPKARALYVTLADPTEDRRRYTEEAPFGNDGMNWDWEEDPTGQGNDTLLGVEVLLGVPLEVLPQGLTGNAPSSFVFAASDEER